MLSLTSVAYRLLWAALIGAVIGVERNVRRRPAGMRTSMCVCIGAALFTLLSSEIARLTGDSGTTRIASNIVQGIGFLGAGVILRERGSVVGLTTAATIFAEAAIGMAAGAGLYRISGIAGLIVLFALVAMVPFENRLDLKRRYVRFRIAADSTAHILPEARRIFGDFNVAMDNFAVSMSEQQHVITFDADVSHRQQEKILAAFAGPGVTLEMKPVERQYE
jgi:putative Mg2+ transporter-C (MgtC) family protein